MRMIFENDGEEDFFEIVLMPDEIDALQHHTGVMMDFPYGFRNLNVFVRPQQIKEFKNATSERKESQLAKRLFRKRAPRDARGKTAKASGSDCV